MSTTVQLERWSPTKAAQALGKNHVNRNIRERKVVQYSRDMKEGRWTFCPDPIAFDKNGNLINGQHRLTAQVEAGVNLQWVVVRDAPEDTQQTMDTGAGRSLADLLTIGGMSANATIGATARLCLQMETGRITSQARDSGASNKEILEFLEENPSIEHSARAGMKASRGGLLRYPASPLGGAHWWISKHVGVEEADMFLFRMTTLAGEPEGSPVIALVKRLNEIQRSKQRIHPRWIVYMVLKAWNLDATGQKAAKINSTTRSGEYVLIKPLPPGSSPETAEE